jgi:hypothetical protein
MFREGEEGTFPWDMRGSEIRFALLCVRAAHIERQEFGSSSAEKERLRDVLAELRERAVLHLLLGVWNGRWRTDLFVLETDKVIAELDALRQKKCERLRGASKVVKLVGPKGGFRALSYDYVDDSGARVHVREEDREEGQYVDQICQSDGIQVVEEQQP